MVKFAVNVMGANLNEIEIDCSNLEFAILRRRRNFVLIVTGNKPNHMIRPKAKSRLLCLESFIHSYYLFGQIRKVN